MVARVMDAMERRRDATPAGTSNCYPVAPVFGSMTSVAIIKEAAKCGVASADLGFVNITGRRVCSAA